MVQLSSWTTSGSLASVNATLSQKIFERNGCVSSLLYPLVVLICLDHVDIFLFATGLRPRWLLNVLAVKSLFDLGGPTLTAAGAG